MAMPRFSSIVLSRDLRSWVLSSEMSRSGCFGAFGGLERSRLGAVSGYDSGRETVRRMVGGSDLSSSS